MKKRILISIAIIISTFICCNTKTGDIKDKIVVNETIDDKDCIEVSLTANEILEIKKHIEFQKRIESEDNNNIYEMTERDTELASHLMIKSLIQQGYKIPSNSDYFSILKSVFNINSNHLDKECNVSTHDNFFVYLISQGNDNAYLKETEYDYTYNHIFFIKNNNFITWAPYLENFVKEIKGNTIKIYPEPIIVHRNKFLFNDSNASLAWLLNNDLEFLEILVREFGYDKNDKINQAILDKVNKEYLSRQPRHYKDLINLFVRKKESSSEIEIREGLLKTIVATSDTDLEPLMLAYNYASHLSNSKDGEPFTQNERLKILSYFGYYIQLVYNQTDHIPERWYGGSFLRNELIGNEELLEHIRENNYYNLSNYKEKLEAVLDQIEETGRIHPLVKDED